jgi:hypothetical protein
MARRKAQRERLWVAPSGVTTQPNDCATNEPRQSCRPTLCGVLPFAVRAGTISLANKPARNLTVCPFFFLTTPVPDEGEKYGVLRRLRGIKSEANGRVSVQCMNDFVAEIIIFSTLLIQDIGFKVTWEKTTELEYVEFDRWLVTEFVVPQCPGSNDLHAIFNFASTDVICKRSRQFE